MNIQDKKREIDEKIDFILTVKPTYVKKCISKKDKEQIKLVHQKSCIIELLDQNNQEWREKIKGLKRKDYEDIGRFISVKDFNQSIDNLLKEETK